MSTIEISKDYIVTGAEYSSLGSQMKWKQDGYWYKADMLGFESLAEAVSFAETFQYRRVCSV